MLNSAYSSGAASPSLKEFMNKNGDKQKNVSPAVNSNSQIANAPQKDTVVINAQREDVNIENNKRDEKPRISKKKKSL